MAKQLSPKKQQPKPKRPPSNLAEARARQGKPNAKSGGGPPFRAKTYGDPEPQL